MSLFNLAQAEHTIDSNWRAHSVKRTDLVQVSQYCPERPYVELQIPEFVRVQTVKKVLFTIVSHDQGIRLTFKAFRKSSNKIRLGHFPWILYLV